MTETPKTFTDLTPKQQAMKIVLDQIEHWKQMEKSLCLDPERIRHKIGALKFVLELINKAEIA